MKTMKALNNRYAGRCSNRAPPEYLSLVPCSMVQESPPWETQIHVLSCRYWLESQRNHNVLHRRRIVKSRDGSVGIATGYVLDGRGLIFGRSNILSTARRPALGPVVQWTVGALFLGMKRSGREADHFHLVPRSRLV
jgi:hypothetical protein